MIPAADYRENHVTRTDRWGKRFYLIEVSAIHHVLNVVDRDGEYVATVQRTQSGWRWYDEQGHGSRKPITGPGATGGMIDAFYAAVRSTAVRRKYDR